jgi:hypothetical protein
MYRLSRRPRRIFSLAVCASVIAPILVATSGCAKQKEEPPAGYYTGPMIPAGGKKAGKSGGPM